jgi:predicted nucleic acid-binding protein
MPVFIDTSVLVYAFDHSEPDRKAIAAELLGDPAADFVTSAQVLSEFYVTTTRKLEPPLAHDAALAALEHLRRLPVVALDDRLVVAAAATAEANSLSLWDAQIIEAAARTGCEEVLTEDLNDGQSISGVVVRNPFA